MADTEEMVNRNRPVLDLGRFRQASLKAKLRGVVMHKAMACE